MIQQVLVSMLLQLQKCYISSLGPLDLLGSLMSGTSSGAHLAITHLNKSHDVVDCLVLDVLLQKLDPIYNCGIIVRF